jgi:hypothetical protein
MFHKIFYDDVTESIESIRNKDCSVYAETYVKVVVVNKQNPFVFDLLIENLYKAGASDISIVEDFSETLIDADQDLIDQAEDTMTILSKYIDNLTLNVEADKLKHLMRELYVEAINTETTE